MTDLSPIGHKSPVGDIVERLRLFQERTSWPEGKKWALVNEAAAEIERLRTEITRLERAYDHLREMYMNTVAR